MYKLMIVDDSNIIRNRIARSEEESGLFTVVAKAKNGQEAVQLFQEHGPELVTMDLTMPNMDGLECIKELIELDPDVKILVVSALSDKPTAIKALKLGARGFLCKPFSEEDIVESLSKIIDADE